MSSSEKSLDKHSPDLQSLFTSFLYAVESHREVKFTCKLKKIIEDDFNIRNLSREVFLHVERNFIKDGSKYVNKMKNCRKNWNIEKFKNLMKEDIESMISSYSNSKLYTDYVSIVPLIIRLQQISRPYEGVNSRIVWKYFEGNKTWKSFVFGGAADNSYYCFYHKELLQSIVFELYSKNNNALILRSIASPSPPIEVIIHSIIANRFLLYNFTIEYNLPHLKAEQISELNLQKAIIFKKQNHELITHQNIFSPLGAQVERLNVFGVRHENHQIDDQNTLSFILIVEYFKTIEHFVKTMNFYHPIISQLFSLFVYQLNSLKRSEIVLGHEYSFFLTNSTLLKFKPWSNIVHIYDECCPQLKLIIKETIFRRNISDAESDKVINDFEQLRQNICVRQMSNWIIIKCNICDFRCPIICNEMGLYVNSFQSILDHYALHYDQRDWKCNRCYENVVFEEIKFDMETFDTINVRNRNNISCKCIQKN